MVDTAYSGDNIQVYTLTADNYEDFEVLLTVDTDTITDASIDSEAIVTLNGVVLCSTEFSITGNVLTLTETAYSGDAIQVYSFGEAA